MISSSEVKLHSKITAIQENKCVCCEYFYDDSWIHRTIPKICDAVMGIKASQQNKLWKGAWNNDILFADKMQHFFLLKFTLDFLNTNTLCSMTLIEFYDMGWIKYTDHKINISTNLSWDPNKKLAKIKEKQRFK